MNELAKLEDVLVNGDLQSLKAEDRVMYYKKVCESVGLNPLTKPFEYIRLNGKLTLYARKDATDQLRTVHGISIKITSREKIEDVYIVTAQASNKEGRCDESTGAVNVKSLAGEALANAFMKAETKAKRRVTLSIAGLGLLDENEVETIPGALRVDMETGEVIESPAKEYKKYSPHSGLPPPTIVVVPSVHAKAMSDLFEAKDLLGAAELLDTMSLQEKTDMWPNLIRDEKDWVKNVIKNMPKEVNSTILNA